MSTIDYDFHRARMAHEKGDRVRIRMTGKVLPCRSDGAEQGMPACRYEEE